MAKSMVAQVAELQDMTQEELKQKWQALYDNSPPATLSRQQLIRATGLPAAGIGLRRTAR